MTYTPDNWRWWANVDVRRAFDAACDRLHLMGCADPEAIVREAMRAAANDRRPLPLVSDGDDGA